MEEVQLDSDKSAKTQEAILNYTIEQIKYKKEARATLLNALLFRYGILWHGYKGDFGMTDEQSLFIEDEQVFVKNLSPKDFIFDPKVTLSNIEEARWVGRKLMVPLRELQDDPDIKLEKKMKGKEGFAKPVDFLRPNSKGNDTRTTQRNFNSLLDHTPDRDWETFFALHLLL